MHISFSFYFWYFGVMKRYYSNVATVLINHLKTRKTYFPLKLYSEFFSNFEKLFWTLKPTKLPIFKKICKNDSEKFQIMRFSCLFCLPLAEFFLSIRTEISARSLPPCQILQIFTVNFQRYFRSKYKFCKIFECTRSLDLHLREPGVLARARAISGPGRPRQETISSHLKWCYIIELADRSIKVTMEGYFIRLIASRYMFLFDYRFIGFITCLFFCMAATSLLFTACSSSKTLQLASLLGFWIHSHITPVPKLRTCIGFQSKLESSSRCFSWCFSVCMDMVLDILKICLTGKALYTTLWTQIWTKVTLLEVPRMVSLSERSTAGRAFSSFRLITKQNKTTLWHSYFKFCF